MDTQKTYDPSVTITKAGAPAVFILVAAKALKFIDAHTGISLSGNEIFELSIGLWSLWVGALNWFKNRKK